MLQLEMFPKTPQVDRVLRMLRENPAGVCAVDFLDARIPRFGGRIFDLRHAGYVIENHPCRDPIHQSRQVRYVLIGEGYGNRQTDQRGGHSDGIDKHGKV